MYYIGLIVLSLKNIGRSETYLSGQTAKSKKIFKYSSDFK